MLASIVLSYVFLDETHPDRQSHSGGVNRIEAEAETALMATAGATGHAGADLRAESYGTFNAISVEGTESWLVNSDGTDRDPVQVEYEASKTFTHRVIVLVVALGIFTYHSMTYDHLLPIFLEDERDGTDVLMTATHTPSLFDMPGGLGFSTQTVGGIMTVNGLIAIFIQGIIFPPLAEWLGVWKMFVVTSVLQPLAYLVVPFWAVLPPRWLMPGIYASLTLRNLFSILAYPVILILLKEAAPSHAVLGKINGLAASAGAICRTMAPPITGWLYGVGARQGFTGLAWWGSAMVAMAGSVQCFFVERDRYKKAHVQSAAHALPCRAVAPPKNEVIHITVEDVDA